MSTARDKYAENETTASKLGKAALAATLAASIGVPTANSMQQAELPDVVPLTLVIDNNPPAPDMPATVDDQDHSDKARKLTLKLIMKIATIAVAAALALFGVVQCAGTYLTQFALPGVPISQVGTADESDSASSVSASTPATSVAAAAVAAVSAAAGI